MQILDVLMFFMSPAEVKIPRERISQAEFVITRVIRFFSLSK